MYDLKHTLARALLVLRARAPRSCSALVLRARAPRSCSALVLGEERKEEARSPMGTGGGIDVDEPLSSPPRIERPTGPLTEPNRTMMPVSHKRCQLASVSMHCCYSIGCSCAQNGDGAGIGELAVFVNIHGSDGRCAPHVVSSTGSAQGARMLIHSGADVAARTARYQPPATSTPGCFGETPLHLAVRGGHRVTCAVLIEMGSPLEQFDDLGFQPLHRHCREERWLFLLWLPE